MKTETKRTKEYRDCVEELSNINAKLSNWSEIHRKTPDDFEEIHSLQRRREILENTISDIKEQQFQTE